MRKRSKCAFLATAMAATTILAAGCGNSASGGQNTADSAERVPIRWLTTGDAAAEAIQDNDRIIEAINEKLGIDLTVEIVPEANTEKVNVAMASGDFPDVVTGAYGTSATQQWIDDGMVIPLNDYMDGKLRVVGTKWKILRHAVYYTVQCGQYPDRDASGLAG